MQYYETTKIKSSSIPCYITSLYFTVYLSAAINKRLCELISQTLEEAWISTLKNGKITVYFCLFIETFVSFRFRVSPLTLALRFLTFTEGLKKKESFGGFIHKYKLYTLFTF